jgi:putative SOS response-associated peptidase YedK
MFAYPCLTLQITIAVQLEHCQDKLLKTCGLLKETFPSSSAYTRRMCGRYRRKSDKQRIAEAFQVEVGLDDLPYEEGDDLRPQSLQPVIFTNDDGERQIELMRWAFKLPDRLLFNARSEAIERSKFWKEAFLTGRCIVPADAIYEWQEAVKGKKPKYEFTIPGQEPFGMAAVWKRWKNPKTDHWERTFAVLTGEPNELMQPIHDRMTTFLEPGDYLEYLTPVERPPVHLLRIFPADKMNATLIETIPATNMQVSLFDSQSRNPDSPLQMEPSSPRRAT